MSDGVTRRDASKMVAAVPLAAPALVRAAPEQVVFGLIGAGAWGQYLLGQANRIASGRCAAVCDVDEANLRQAVGSARDKRGWPRRSAALSSDWGVRLLRRRISQLSKEPLKPR